MTASLQEITTQLHSKETQQKSIKIANLLKSMGAAPTAAQKNKLSSALSECTAFVLVRLSFIQ